MNRRSLLLLPAAGMAAAQSRPAPDLSALPNFCAHEHWGSIPSIGSVPEGFRADVEAGAAPRRRTGLLDLVLDPYFRGWMTSSGSLTADLARQLETRSGWDAFSLLRPSIAQHRFTGVYQCLRRGLLRLYNHDLSRLDRAAFTRLDDAIAANYSRHLAWYRKAMRAARFSELIRPVHLEFFTRSESAAGAEAELAFTRTVLRIDPLLQLDKPGSSRRAALAAMAGVEPADAKSWREFLARLFERAAAHSAAGIKQLQAYRRGLDFIPRSDSEIRWSGGRTPAETRAFEDWVVHECSKLAHERGWPHQVHTGTHNLAESSPLPLAALARRYPRMKIVMIHCWPFLSEAGWLAKQLPNVYIDTCWQPVLNPEFLRQSLHSWWNYVPVHKMTCSHDSTSVEMAVGSSLFTREILSEVLRERARGSGGAEKEVLQAAADVLHNNAAAIYGAGRRQV